MLTVEALQKRLQDTIKEADQAQTQAREWTNKALFLQGRVATFQEMLDAAQKDKES
jgi:hypothetical protein